MTTAATAFLALALLAAVADWVAAHREMLPLEYVAKPGVMVALIGVAATLDGVDGTTRAIFIGALALSMAGDVFLMLPDRERWFVFGLASFLLGHLCYIPGLWRLGVSGTPMAIGAVLVVAAASVVGRRVVGAVRADKPALLGPVIAYMVVLGAMAVSAVGTGRPFGVVGGLLFFSSDSILAWNEFVERVPLARLLVHVTYHLAQVGLVLALL